MASTFQLIVSANRSRFFFLFEIKSNYLLCSYFYLFQISKPWTIILQDNDLDFREGEPRSAILNLKLNSINHRAYALRLRTTANQSTPFTLNYKINPLDDSTGVIYACILLFGLYMLIIFEVICFKIKLFHKTRRLFHRQKCYTLCNNYYNYYY